MARPKGSGLKEFCVRGHEIAVVGRYAGGNCIRCSRGYSRNQRQRKGAAPKDPLELIRLPSKPLLDLFRQDEVLLLGRLDRLPEEDRDRVQTWHARRRKSLSLDDIDRIACCIGLNPVLIYPEFLEVDA